MSVSALPSSPFLVSSASSTPAGGVKIAVRSSSGIRTASSGLAGTSDYAGLERLDREELDEDYVPPSRQRVA